MGLRCRQEVKAGDGSQFLEKDGSFSRLCPECATERMRIRDLADPIPVDVAP